MRRTLLALSTVALLLAPAAPAQIVRGTIIDAATDQPIQDALVVVVDVDGRNPFGGARSGPDGAFGVATPSAGRFRLRVTRIGYRELTSGTFDIDLGEAVTMRIRLSAAAQIQTPVRITERRRLALDELASVAGFELRRSKGIGTFLTADSLADAAQFEDLLNRIPGLATRTSDIADYIVLRGARGECTPDVYIDGALVSGGRVGRERALELVSAIPTRNLYGIELFRQHEVPPPSLSGLYGARGGGCGILALYTVNESRSLNAALAGREGHDDRLVLRGIVVDDSTHRPIRDAVVGLLNEDGTAAGRTTRTDSLGRFTLGTATAGRFRIRASRIGYRQVTTPSFAASPGEVTSVELVMSATAQVLAPLTIVDSYRPLARAMLDPHEGFEWRRRLGNGTYLTREDLEQRSGTTVMDMLRGIVGVRIGRGETGTPIVRMARAVGPVNMEGDCAPAVFVDGRLIRDEGFEFLELFAVNEIMGIEIYKGPSQVPAEFAGRFSGCGAIAVWSRR